MDILSHSHPVASFPIAKQCTSPTPGLIAEAVEFVRQSQKLVSMLPWAILAGSITLVMTAVMQFIGNGLSSDFLGVWMKTWLIAWLIAFPFAYMVGPFLMKYFASIAPAKAKKSCSRRLRGGHGPYDFKVHCNLQDAFSVV